MDTKLIALKLFLDALGIPPAIDTVEDRKRMQKAVYLGQLSGIDLGYRFGWYIMGPYSTGLTRDYYALQEQLQLESIESKQLREDARDKLSQLAPLLKPPTSWTDSFENWLELLASYHFLRKISRQSHLDAVSTLREQKPHIAAYVDMAVGALDSFNVLS